MTVLNLTPHAVQVYKAEQFVNLEQVNPTTWVADSVEGSPIAEYESNGVARISTKTTTMPTTILGIEMVRTEYGEATGIPETATAKDLIIVSLPMQSMAKASGHHLVDAMVAPYKVVRSRANGSVVLGCMGFTY